MPSPCDTTPLSGFSTARTDGLPSLGRSAALRVPGMLERSLIVERVKTGLRNARAKGKRLGRPRVVLDARRIATLRACGQTLTQQQILGALVEGNSTAVVPKSSEAADCLSCPWSACHPHTQ